MPRIVNSSLHGNDVIFPTSYRLQEILLTNHQGRQTDISRLVTDFSITESIYLPSLVLELNIKDPLNLIEEFQLSGQERIQVKISKKPHEATDETEKTVTKEFYVTEYPVYGKYPNRLQVYTLKGISEHAFLSKFKKISRAYSGNIKDFVFDVLTRDLSFDGNNIKISDRSSGSAAFIVPNLAPLDAIAWALRRAFDSGGSPWYCYESLYDGIRIASQGEMVQKDPYYTYQEILTLSADPLTKQDYDQRRSMIASIASDLKMSKYIAGANGAFGATTEYIDIHTKKRTKRNFVYSSEFNNMEWTNSQGINLSPSFEVNGENLDTYNSARVTYLPINSKSYDDYRNYHSTTLDGQLDRANSYVQNLDNLVHDLTVAGDFDLNAGNTVNIKLFKSIDPQLTIQNAEESDDAETNKWDDALSGKYLVTSVVHKFAEEYESEMRIKRDSGSPLVQWSDTIQ